MRRRLARIGMWAAGAVCVAAAALLARGLWRPGTVGMGGLAVGVRSGQIEGAWSSGRVSRQPIAWGVQTERGSASVLAPTGLWWRPRAEVVDLGMTRPDGSPELLAVAMCPLWPVAVLGGGVAGMLWWRTRRVVMPGHCAGCGYDLRGLGGGRCPECGREGLRARAMRLLGGGRPRTGRLRERGAWAA